MSLLYTLQGIQKYGDGQFRSVVALAKWTKELSDFYTNAGYEVLKPPKIDTYEHTQAVHFNLWNPIQLVKEIIQVIRIRKAKLNTEILLSSVKPDIVHLNSVVLLGSALATKKTRIPLVWHVREHSANGLLRLRRSILIHYLKAVPDKVIFICRADMSSWGNPRSGIVIYNFVDFDTFNLKIDKATEIDEVKIPQGDLNILFLGGVSEIKGGIYLIKAINNLVIRNLDKKIYLLFPGSIYKKPSYFIYRVAVRVLPIFGLNTYSQRIEREINCSVRPESFIRLSFVKNVVSLFSVSDVLVFSSIRPHFARPIIEAGAMGKPVIGSRLGGVEELIVDSANGFFVRPKNVCDIEEKLEFCLNHKKEIAQMGIKGHSIAVEKFNSGSNVIKIIEIYNSI